MWTGDVTWSVTRLKSGESKGFGRTKLQLSLEDSRFRSFVKGQEEVALTRNYRL